jgi:hypothetical protein
MTNPTSPSRLGERLARIAAIVPPAVSCLLFAVARSQPDSPLAVWLAPAFPLEAIVVHAGAVLGIAILAWPRTWRGHLAYWIVLGVLAAFYVKAAIDAGATPLQFLLLAFVTYGGVLWATDRRRTAVGVETALRWLIAVVLVSVTVGVVGAPPSIAEWHDIPSLLLAGAVYFGLLAAVEATGLYVALRRIGAAQDTGARG